MNEWTPTGRRRHRSERRWGRERLILQVEVRGIETTWSGGMIDSQHVNCWRDATTADLTVREQIGSTGAET